jgi:hypothetical protein
MNQPGKLILYYNGLFKIIKANDIATLVMDLQILGKHIFT